MESQPVPMLPVHNETSAQSSIPCATAYGEITGDTTQSTKKHPPGYPTLAEWMGLVPEQAIFRRFAGLNAQNLLYLQAELVNLERQLHDQQLADSRDPCGNKGEYATNWFSLSQSRRDGDEEQLRLVLKIREKLKEFNSFIIQQQTIRMAPPSAYDLDFIQRYLEGPEMGPLALSGSDSDIWGSVDEPEAHSRDLIALLSRHDDDAFSRLITEKATRTFFRVGWPRPRNSRKARHLRSFEDEDLLRWAHRITSIVASALPVGSIILLNFVGSSAAKLVVVVIFNILLSFCLVFFTTARSVDIFAVAAAFSAVQVAFLQAGTSTCGE